MAENLPPHAGTAVTTRAANSKWDDRFRFHRLIKSNSRSAVLIISFWLYAISLWLYITVPLGSINPAERREDSWIIAASLFEPCYIGGWSACEHWGLTEQIFKDLIVITAHKIRKRKISIQKTPFILKQIQKKKIFGTKIVWRQQIKVKVSDPSRTLVDILDDPSIGGGMRHMAEIISQYFAGEYKDTAKLLEYIKMMSNRTIYKRLGYLIETLNLNYPNVIETC